MPSQNYLFPEYEPPIQHGLFDAADAPAESVPRRRLTTEEIDRVRDVPGFPIATDEAIIALSDPPYYTACPNPFLAEIVAGWHRERAELRTGLGLPDASADTVLADPQSTIPTPHSTISHREPFAADVSEGKNDPIYNAHSYHTKVPHKAIMRYILHYTDPGDIVFDGFCGTGMTGVAAQLCGDRAAVESLGYIVDDEGNIYDGVGGGDGAEAPTTNDGSKLVVGASAPLPFSRLGARKAVLNDLSPAATFIAYNYNTPVDAAAFEREARRILAEVEAECGWMYETTHTDGRKGRINYTVWSDVFVCPNCGSEIVFWDATLDFENREVLEVIKCPTCGVQHAKGKLERTIESIYDRALGKIVNRGRQVPVLINYSVGKQRFEKRASQEDLELLTKIEQTGSYNEIPIVEMMFKQGQWGELWRAGYHFGVTHVHHFFTTRSLQAFDSLWKSIAQSAAQSAVKLALLGGFRVGLRMSVFRAALWFDKTSGPMKNLTPGILYLPSLSGEQNWFNIFQEKIATIHRQLAAVRERFLRENTIITTGSNTNVFPMEGGIDYIFTDPPFGGNLIYSELNFIAEAWLRVFTNTRPEAIVSSFHRKALDEYQDLMERAFQNYFRVLKPGRWMTVEFHNANNSVWGAIQEAISRAGFVIADVRTLDKKQGTFKQLTTTGAVKSDLVISAYKPRTGFEQRFAAVKGTEDGAWAFVREHLAAVPSFVTNKGRVEVIAERMPYLLFDRMVAFHLQRGATVPLSAAQFYAGLTQRFPERDGMHFLETQAAEYDQKRATAGAVEQFTFYVSDEKSSLQWLRQLLAAEGPQSYQQIQPRFLQELQQSRSELLPELRDLLQASFIQDDAGCWLIPDPANELHLEQLRRRELLREYETYRQGKGKLKSVRSEAVRAGFAEAYARGDYAGILAVATRLPEAVLREDSAILTYYDLAQMEVEE